MAFNPFNVFRRNQRLLFAVLTVFIMLMFTLSFGQGDFFDWLPRVIGSKRATGEVLAVIDGDKVYQSEAERVNRQRILANQYMLEAGQRASVNLARYIESGVSRVSAENRQAIQEFLQARPFYIDPLTAFLIQQGQATQEQVSQSRQETISKIRESLEKIVTAKDPKPNDLDVAQVALTLLELDLRLQQDFGRTAPHYFANQPNAGTRDLVNFILWQKKADELGIYLTDDDVAELVAAEFSRKVSGDELRDIRDGLKGRVQGFTQELLTEALKEEFRVRAAQAAVIGPSYVRPAVKTFDAPYDYYQFYADQIAPVRFGVISVPVANYLDRVEGSPSTTEMRELFGKYRNQEPSPAESRPGFKEPRKVKLEWIEVTGKEPYYQAAAAEGLPKSEALAKAAFFLAAGNLGGEAALLAAPAPAGMPDLTLQARYQQYLKDHRNRASMDWFGTSFGSPKPLDASVVRLPNVIDLIGTFAGSYATAGNPLSPAAEFVGHAYAADKTARLNALQPALVAPAGPGVMTLPYPFALSAVVGGSAPPLPLASVRGMLTDKAKEEFARTVARADLTKFTDELTKLGVKTEANKGEAQRKVEEFIKTRGLTGQHGGSTDFRDVYGLAEDPGLQPLKDRLDTELRNSLQPGLLNPRQFGEPFFTDFDPATRQMSASTGLYKPLAYPQGTLEGALRENDSVFLVWRTADQEAKAPRTLDDEGVRAKVEAAWRRMKARELARKDAEELAKKTQNLGANFFTIEPKLKDIEAQFSAQFASPQAQDRVKYFTLDRVAPLTEQQQANPLRFAPSQTEFVDYRVPPSQEIPYPDPTMAEELLRVRNEPPSTSVVLSDRPQDRFYVAVQLGRDEPMVYRFASQVWGPSAPAMNPLFGGGTGGLGPAISQRHQAELRKQRYERALAALKAEFNYEKEHELVGKKADETAE